jgi:hypothetical protein
VRRLPRALHWLFWETEPRRVDVDAHANAIIPRVLERGRWSDVRWLLGVYGIDRIHRFLRDVGHPELGPRTIAFWRAALRAEDETWADPRACRPLSAAPWID